MILKESIKEECSDVGMIIEDDEILEKMVTLCDTYRLDAESIATEWMAYHASKKLKGNITLHYLDAFERERLAKKSENILRTPKTPSISRQPNDMFTTPVSNRNKRQHTPDDGMNKRMAALGNSPVVNSPSSRLSATEMTPSKKYGLRTNKGELIADFGSGAATWKSTRSDEVQLSFYDAKQKKLGAMKYMFQKMIDKACILTEQIEEMAVILQKHYGFGEPYPVGMPCQDEAPITLVGRVCCDSNGKLNSKSVLLQGASKSLIRDMCCRLDLSEVERYSLIPGQIIAVEGHNTTGNVVTAKKIYEGIAALVPDSGQTGSLSVIAAAGPFSTTDSLAYEPLNDLLEVVSKTSPDLCLLIGPFVDCKHPLMETLEEGYDELYESLLDKVSATARRVKTKFVLVSSLRDLHLDNIYPTPAYEAPENKYGALNFAPDPCLLSVDGVLVAVSSTDVLFHIGAEEIANVNEDVMVQMNDVIFDTNNGVIFDTNDCRDFVVAFSNPTNTDRISRLAHHIFAQRSFYPIYPAAEDMCIDYDHSDFHTRIPVTPHVSVLPSDLRCFVKEVSGSCVVNPGRLTKGQVGGGYARFVLHPQQSDSSSLSDCIKAEIVRI